tara:strand:- start:402 stop:815 length:414 start_codon:yes stop_codon:yes gene_type:complete
LSRINVINRYYWRSVAATSGETFDTINPATSEVICQVQKARLEDLNNAVISALQGFKIWSRMTGTKRGRILNKAVVLLRLRNQEVAELEVIDTGKPTQEADCVDVTSGADCIEYFASLHILMHRDHLIPIGIIVLRS